MVRRLPASSPKAVIVSLHQFISYANVGIQLKELLTLPPSLILWYPCRQQTYTHSQPTFCLLPATQSNHPRKKMPTFSFITLADLPFPALPWYEFFICECDDKVTHFGSDMAQKPYSVALWFSSLPWKFLTQSIALGLSHGYISLVTGK